MTLNNQDSKLAVAYEKVRRREYEVISKLLEIIPKVDGLGDERLNQMRDALFHADHPFLLVFVGSFSSGKSSLINALLGKSTVLPVGVTPTTDRITMLRYGEEEQTMRTGDVNTVFYPSPILQKVSFVDTPGLESIFQNHEEQTRRFLHRSDAVLLVMLATQAMTARNLEYLKMLKDYGKTVIIILNQVDLLTLEEVETVKQYVADQSRDLLGYRAEIWSMSAKQGLEAYQADGVVDETAWRASGMNQLEAYLDRQLHDVARLKQKLQTPLQIAHSVHQTALDAVRNNQSALDHYQGIRQNVEQQLTVYQNDQNRAVREITDQVMSKFGETVMRGGEAISDIFQISQAFKSVLRGFTELVGLAGIFRRADQPSFVRLAFERRKVFEPLNELPMIVEKLAPRLEGKDIQDIEDLTKYGRKEIESLPENIRTKVIGTLQIPTQYDRSVMQKIRPELDTIENDTRQVETVRLENSVRNALIYLATWELLLVILGIFILAWNPATPEQPLLPLFLIIILIGVGLLGLLILPLRGRMLEAQYSNRIYKLQTQYIDTLTKAADKQVGYGMQLRRDAIAPLTRLVEAQTQIQTEQLVGLQSAQHEMTEIEKELAALGKRF